MNEHSVFRKRDGTRLVRFDPRRAARGAPAAEVEVNGERLWMDKKDLRKNREIWGDLQGLLDAERAYRGNGKEQTSPNHA